MGNLNTSFIRQLESRLKGPLPGKQAQYIMAPGSRLVNETASLQPENPKSGSVLIALTRKGDDLVFPIIQRAEYDGAHSGQVSLPGGKMEDGDKDLYETAIREASEEIGINVEGIEILGELTEIYVHASRFKILPVVAYLASCQVYKLDEKEVVDIMEVNIKELTDSRRIKHTKINLDSGPSINAPYYDFHGKVVWGATAMILSEFSSILRQM